MQNKTSVRRRPHIGFKIIIKMALMNLKYKRFRSSITILGVIIGIGSIYLLTSFGLGLQRLVETEVIGNQSINTVDISPASSAIVKLSPDNVQRIKSIANVSEFSGVYMLASQVTLDGSSVDLVAYGIDSSYFRLSNLSLQSGNPINSSKSDEIIINTSLLDSIGIDDPASSIGKQIHVNLSVDDGQSLDKTMQIVGVVNSGIGSEIFLPQKAFQEANLVNFTQAKVVVNERDLIPSVRSAIESMGYETTSPVDTLNQINEVFRIFNILLIGLGSTGMVIAILGMINTLTVSLLERTREIALMRAIGARPRDMRRLFMVEAVSLSLIGGVVAIILGTLLGWLINTSLNNLASNRGVTDHFSVFYTPWQLVAGAVVFSILLGLLVAFLPARRAARIDPIQALRQD